MNLAELATLFPNYSGFEAIAAPSGQKEVVSAFHGERRVAIKLFYRVADDRERIDREMAAVSKLHCAFVPEVIESGTVILESVERIFLIEQFIEGQTYATLLEADPVQPIQPVVNLAHILLHVAVDCETTGLVHRDLKPANIIRDGSGRFWVLDFGLVKHLDLTSITPTGHGVGTLGYAPIEQMRLMKAPIDIRADLFAIGTILYESLCGFSPWRQGVHDIHDLMRKMSTQELPRLTIPRDTNNELSSFIGWLVQRFPSRRPQAAAEAHAAFEPILKANTPRVS
jgi:serine/threonine protein kinase